MKALVYTGGQQSEIRDVASPAPQDGQCIVEVANCGICGSDMHAWHGHDPRRVPPLVLGHEAVGIVRTGKLAGQRVAINPLMTCGHCNACTGGKEHLCAGRELIGMRVPGAFAEQVAISENNLTVLDDDAAFEQVALAEPLACALHAANFAFGPDRKAPTDLKVAVLGGGAIGLLSALYFRLKGVADLWIAETNPLRRKILESRLDLNAWDPISEPNKVSDADVVLDAVGSGATRAAASNLTRPGGLIIHIGLQDNEPGLDTRRLTLQEISFIGTYCYTGADFAEAIRLLQSREISGSGWCDIRPLDEGAVSFEDIHNGAAAPKIILSISDI